ncbi:MAG: GAF domain-containing SpoIIE family protein phosphatase [Planctomycetota bacterium]
MTEAPTPSSPSPPPAPPPEHEPTLDEPALDASPTESGTDSAGLSINEFLTDGALAMLCRELSQLTGQHVELRDERDHLIVPIDDDPIDADAPQRWHVLDVADAPPVPGNAERIPLAIEGHTIGTIILAPNPDPNAAPTPVADVEARVRRTLELLASTGSELCRDVLELRHRVKELGVLYRLSALLAARTPVDDMLAAALDSALGALNLDAGAVVLLPDDADGVPVSDNEEDLRTVTSSGLSEAWINSPMPLSRGRLFDRIALGGEVLVVEDLAQDPRVLEPDQCEDERVRTFIAAPMVVRDRPIGLIRLYSRTVRHFSEGEKRLLRSIGEQSAAAVAQARLLLAQKHERRMERQLALASDVQHRMLPRELPRFPGIDVAARSVASYELAGDFYDLFDVGGSLGVVVGDVVGKGVAAALLMSAVRASLRAHVQNVYDIDEVMARVNRAMCADTLDNEFATLWYGTIDPNTRVLTYASAGHDPPFIVRSHPGKPPTHESVHPLGIGGLVLGIDPEQDYHRFIHKLEPGDVLIALTDGITDARNFDNERFGWTRLVQSVIETLTETPSASAAHILEQVFWNLRRFAGLRKQVDDETLVVLRIS